MDLWITPDICRRLWNSPWRRDDAVATRVAVIAAAGMGSRCGFAKQFAPLGGRTTLWHAVAPFADSGDIDAIRVVVADDGEAAKRARAALADFAGRCETLPAGGETRAETVRNGLDGLDDDDWAVVHDAARPCLSAAALARLLAAPGEGAALGLPMSDSLRREDGGFVRGVVERRQCWRMQTPQRFRAGALRAALAAHPQAADESEAMWRQGAAARLVLGDADNIKITRAEDLALAAALLAARGDAAAGGGRR